MTYRADHLPRIVDDGDDFVAGHFSKCRVCGQAASVARIVGLIMKRSSHARPSLLGQPRALLGCLPSLSRVCSLVRRREEKTAVCASTRKRRQEKKSDQNEPGGIGIKWRAPDLECFRPRGAMLAAERCCIQGWSCDWTLELPSGIKQSKAKRRNTANPAMPLERLPASLSAPAPPLLCDHPDPRWPGQGVGAASIRTNPTDWW